MKRSQQLVGNEDADLFRIEHQDKQFNTKICCAAVTEAHKKYLRIGHMSFDSLKLVSPQLENSCTKDIICQICPATKQSRVSFPTSNIKSTAIFFYFGSP